MTATYAMHPLAELVPPMTAEEYAELKADIKAHGLHEPITLYEGKILDGKHRYRAARELGVEIKTRNWRPADGQPVDYVISENVMRRHLTTGQKAALAWELKPEVERQLAQTEGSHPRVRTEGPNNQGAATAVAARRVGIHPTSLAEYGVLAEKAPKMAREVKAGKIAITAAYGDYLASSRPKTKTKPPTLAELSNRARDAAMAFSKAVAALSRARGEFTFMELWAIWAAIFEVQGYLERMAKEHHLPIPETPADLKRLKGKAK